MLRVVVTGAMPQMNHAAAKRVTPRSRGCMTHTSHVAAAASRYQGDGLEELR